MLKSRKCFNSFCCVFILILLVLKINDSNALDYRLDSHIKPVAYDIWIRPFIKPEDGVKQFTFDGEVNITLQAEIANLKQITLHKDYIDIVNASLYYENEGKSTKLIQLLSSVDWNYEQATDKLTFKLQQPLIANQNYILQIVYTGQIRHGMAGVFDANYLDADENLKKIILTQAQRIDARTILPCFDEPAFKAKFRMQISRPKEFISIFNTRLASSDVDKNFADRYIDTFEWSPKMSTYLIAFMLCEYAKISSNNDFVMLTRPEFSNYTTFSYEVALRALKAYGELTRQPYKMLGNQILQKASSPKFPHNGMENWGLVLYKDAVLVHEPGYNDGWNDKQYTLTILVHETAHMWFGNSVTFAWWSYFWLNEAFARYYQYYLAHELHPEYQLDEQFVVRQVHLIFGTDALNTTQPLTTPEILVQSPTQIASKFSGITYAKGASIVRMFRNLMGHQNFDLAIQEYLAEFHLKSVVPSDLFKHLKQDWPKDQAVDLVELFHDWTEKPGFPTLYVNISTDRLKVSVAQKRFLLEKNDGSDKTLKYTIPLTYTTDKEKDFVNLLPKAYLNASATTLTLNLDKPLRWIIFNVQQSNYHRVFYELDIVTAIKAALMKPQHSGIHVINRAQILDDLFNFARVSMLDYEHVFAFAEYLKHETEFAPWYAAFNGLKRVAQRLTIQQQRNFGKFILDITERVYQKLGFESSQDTILDVYNRNDVIYWNCKYSTYGSSDCSKVAQLMLQRANASNTKPSPDFRETLYCSAIRFGDISFYNIIDNCFLKENRSNEKELLLRSMGCTKHFADSHMTRILVDDFPEEYTQLVLNSLYSENPENISPVFNMISVHYENLRKKLGGWAGLANVISDIANYFTTEEQRIALDDFIAENGYKFGTSLATLQRASQTVQCNLQWARDNLKNLNYYLEYRNSAAICSVTVTLLHLNAILSQWI